MQVLAVRHVPFEHLGRIAGALQAAGLECAYWDVYNQPSLAVSPDAYAGFIFMGGPMSANDDLEFIRRELRMIEQALSHDKPVLGVCLGAQLIAKAAGAKVYRNKAKEIGWAPIYWTEAARDDALFAGLDPAPVVFHWHGETFDLPAGAQWLAWSDLCRHQAFRLGASYGIQFHLEVTKEMVADWMCQPDNSADVAGLKEPIDPGLHVAQLAELSDTVFGRWCEMVKAVATGGAAHKAGLG